MNSFLELQTKATGSRRDSAATYFKRRAVVPASFGTVAVDRLLAASGGLRTGEILTVYYPPGDIHNAENWALRWAAYHIVRTRSIVRMFVLQAGSGIVEINAFLCALEVAYCHSLKSEGGAAVELDSEHFQNALLDFANLLHIFYCAEVPDLIAALHAATTEDMVMEADGFTPLTFVCGVGACAALPSWVSTLGVSVSLAQRLARAAEFSQSAMVVMEALYPSDHEKLLYLEQSGDEGFVEAARRVCGEVLGERREQNGPPRSTRLSQFLHFVSLRVLGGAE